ncbi:GNAT family N-acetyltransferase [Pelagerythrobacter rhizovicinus]|uniref:N-acetyltransferase n=1 Tax=Pelagerythrobacter rhizovicinus TaxID=2268576 RepID=A0A4Q2KH41_9SPHN|nr:N-acetyltransferase [Pelagerythrobacter rhizovicinus]RXZ64448.1 N-acetyltransferase [Pelagerythrobacter rhizovicinus]
MSVTIRPERAGDERAIHEVVHAAFDGHPHSDGSEPAIVDRLRADGDLAISLVAEDGGEIVGHAAFSPVTISDGSEGWFGLGPVAVAPQRQREGIGAALVEQGLALLCERDAAGCVVLGDPAYYGRFGFTHDPALTYPGPPPEYFQRLVIDASSASGVVTYAHAFG